MPREYIVNMGWRRNLRLSEHDKRPRNRKPFDGPPGVWIHPHHKPHRYDDSGLIRTVTETREERGALDISLSGHSATVRTAAELKSRIRRIRPQEAAELSRLDSEIAALREQRKETQKLAWQRGHVVTFKEAEEWADEWRRKDSDGN